ncbi:MAG: LPS export ABC transporter permease LptF [Sphingobacteriia bacterium]|nr:LPS export ABC transporter permease LptF [Sphingobacteriia bacterium]NCC37868.1 LPS export ABC transporter permease LptF [Gammaproteobacteria bacterium]
MFGIIDRYLLGETTKVFVAIVAVLVLIVASMLFLRTLEEVNVGALSVHLVLRFLGYQIVRDMPMLLPPAFFLALLVTLSRLSRDSELIALGACGIGPARQLRALLLLALPVALLTGWVALALQPWAATGIMQIRLEQEEQAAQIAGLKAGRFYLEEGGKLVLYIGEMDRQQSLANVFILDRREAITRLVTSQAGWHRVEAETGDHLVTLSNGYRFDGQPGAGAFLIGEFDEYEVRVRASQAPPARFAKNTTFSTRQLLASGDLSDRVELEHRLAAPLAILALTVVAIPLVRLSPRQHGSGRLFLAFLAYFSFFNLQRLAESWLAIGVTPPWLTSLWYQLLIPLVVYLALLPDSLWLRWVLRRPRVAPSTAGRLDAGTPHAR